MAKFRDGLFVLTLLTCGLAASAPACAQTIGTTSNAATGTTTTSTNTTTTSNTGQTVNKTPVTAIPVIVQDGRTGGRGDRSASPSDVCSSGAPALPIWNAGDVADSVKAMSKTTKYYLENCRCPDTACVADALDNYAAALEAIGPRLPPAVADLPAIVRRAARKVRAARSISQARAAIGAAEHVIQAKLRLLEVADPDARSDSIRSARFTDDVLSAADVSLVRVAGL